MAALETEATLFKRAAPVFLARVVGNDAIPINQATLASVRYTVARLNPDDPEFESTVAGHTDVVLTPADVVFDTLVRDALWGDRDNLGYNFRHQIDTTVATAFPRAGQFYRVRYELVPVSGPTIVVRFRIKVI